MRWPSAYVRRRRYLQATDTTTPTIKIRNTQAGHIRLLAMNYQPIGGGNSPAAHPSIRGCSIHWFSGWRWLA